jgi:Phage gp6-like head-tail connector protein
MPLVTLDQAKQHLRVELERLDLDADIAEKLKQAEAGVIDYLKKDAAALGALPAEKQDIIRAAILLWLGALFENREGDADAPAPLSNAVRDLLRRLRDPALA